MGRCRQEFTWELLEEWLEFHETGEVFWKKSPKYNIKVGQPAGHTRRDGYVHLMVRGNSLLLHRAIFFYYHRYLPELVDHIDRNVENNSLDNLRDASKSLNGMNRGVQSNNKLGVQGVYKSSKTAYTAYGKVQGVYERHVCASLEEAVAKRKDIERRRVEQ